jgi:hypothetical protein
MNAYAWLLMFFISAALLLAAWGRFLGRRPREADRRQPTKPKRVYASGPCAFCGEIVPLRQDGEPHARFHNCIQGGSVTRLTAERVSSPGVR